MIQQSQKFKSQIVFTIAINQFFEIRINEEQQNPVITAAGKPTASDCMSVMWHFGVSSTFIKELI